MQRKAITAIVALGAAGAMVLSGCSNSSKSGGTLASSGASGGGSSSSGCSGTGPAYKIGFQGPLSGDNKNLGTAEVQGVNLAVDQANATKKLCFQLSVLTGDDQCSTAPAPAAAAGIIQDATVMGLIGPSCSGATTATAKSYGAAGIAMISPSATNETLTSQGFTTFHRIVPTDGIEGKATADYIAGKYKTVFVLDDSSTYGQGVANVVRDELKAKGVTRVDSQSISDQLKDLSAVAAKIQASGDEAMYYGGYYAQGGLLAKALNAAGYKGFEISGNGAKDPGFVDAGGSAADGFVFACGCLDATTAPAAAAFNKDYTAKFGTPPSTYSPEAFDATNAMISAMTAAAKAGGVTRASVETAVNALNYPGITTTVKFLPSGEVAQATINLYKVTGGKILLVGDMSKQ